MQNSFKAWARGSLIIGVFTFFVSFLMFEDLLIWQRLLLVFLTWIFSEVFWGIIRVIYTRGKQWLPFK